ncbi:MAG: acylphosphatase [Methylothermaceae bacteria B42]|nr:MAG: acylphosphatase [Methylothermaceae bacteria B42]HHJ38573.1 acylphosphatase [Methylothermaceae bacterium]
MSKRLQILVSGKVQGVFYRATAVEVARSLGLKGWVRNLPDGRVEMVAEGEPEALNQLLDWCRQGPPAARVDKVDVEEIPCESDLTGFQIRY